jgi:ABC-type hemin transport system ATPase subunit
MLTAANVTVQFGAKPLFEDISVKFGGGNRYGLIGANGASRPAAASRSTSPSASASCRRTSSRTRTSASSTSC